MAYAKSWTDKYNDGWYLSLKLHERGLWDQLFTYAKMVGDTGRIIGRSWSAWGSLWGCDGRTCRKIVTKMHDDCKVVLTERANFLELEIVNYEYYQRVKKVEAKNAQGNMLQKCSLKQSRAEQSRAEQSNTADKPPDPVDEFVEKYHEICRGFKRARIINDSRRGKIRQRLKELDQAGVTVEEYMQKIADSPFLRGERGDWDGAGFDFIIGAQNIGKILDGKYDRRDSDIDWGNIGKDDEEE